MIEARQRSLTPVILNTESCFTLQTVGVEFCFEWLMFVFTLLNAIEILAAKVLPASRGIHSLL